MKNAQTNVIFVHSQLDDYGLPAPVFRVYGHLARRANAGIAWPGIRSISRVCCLHPQTVRAALRLLVEHGFLQREDRRGDTTRYHLTSPTAWRPRTRIDGNSSNTNTAASDSQGRTAKTMKGYPSEKDIDKGNPSEGNPLKGDPEKTTHTPTKVPIQLPETVEEAIATARQLGIDEAFAAQEFHSKKAVGWKDGYRNPIVSWTDHLQARWPVEQRKRAERRTAPRTSGKRPPGPPRSFDPADYQQSPNEL